MVLSVRSVALHVWNAMGSFLGRDKIEYGGKDTLRHSNFSFGKHPKLEFKVEDLWGESLNPEILN